MWFRGETKLTLKAFKNGKPKKSQHFEAKFLEMFLISSNPGSSIHRRMRDKRILTQKNSKMKNRKNQKKAKKSNNLVYSF